MMDRKGIIEFIFTPTVEFEWVRDGQCVGLYVPGNTYNCSRQEVHDALRDKCAKWKDEGKIKVFPLSFGTNFIISTTSSPEGS